VTKNGLFLVSLVAAVPGAVLVYLMVMSFLHFAGGQSMWPKALAGMSLLIGLLLTFMPVGIFLYGGPKSEKDADKESDADSDDKASDSETILAGSSSSSGATDPNLEVVEAASDEFAMTGEVVTGDHDTSEEFEMGSDFDMAVAEDDSADESAADELEEEAPKKKKKK
jgi:hypothetical protein